MRSLEARTLSGVDVDQKFGRIVMNESRANAVEKTALNAKYCLATAAGDENAATVLVAQSLLQAPGSDALSMAILAGMLAVQLHIERERANSRQPGQ